MWEALMMLRLIASVSPKFSLGKAGRGMALAGRGKTLPARIMPQALPVETLKGAIRLDFAAWRLSLPVSRPNGHGAHDRKIA
ncbi:hypothetical protein FJ958_08345 [Mesorhizobium sp. B2-3-5]|nr:hypothetical protein FJ958_08345 [Mesorhizobium sp. B2-3-5]